jgi:hypothetical protein
LNLKTAAAVAGLLDGIWTTAAGAYWGMFFGISGGAHGGENIILLALGIVLLIDSLVCFTGVLEAFYASAVLALVVVLGILSWGAHPESIGFIGSILLAAITIVMDAAGARRKTSFTEEDHPLNLPVFG